MKKIILIIVASIFIFAGCDGITSKKYEAEKSYEIYNQFLDMKTDELEKNLGKQGFEKTKFWGEEVYLKTIDNKDLLIILTNNDENKFIYIIGVNNLEDVYNGSSKDSSTIISYNNEMLHEDGKLSCGYKITLTNDKIKYDINSGSECKTDDKDGLPTTVNNIIYEMDGLVSNSNRESGLIIVLNFALIVGAVFNMLLIRGRGKVLGTVLVVSCLVAATVILVLADYGMVLSIIIGAVLLMGFVAVWALLKKERSKINIK